MKKYMTPAVATSEVGLESLCDGLDINQSVGTTQLAKDRFEEEDEEFDPDAEIQDGWVDGLW